MNNSSHHTNPDILQPAPELSEQLKQALPHTNIPECFIPLSYSECAILITVLTGDSDTKTSISDQHHPILKNFSSREKHGLMYGIISRYKEGDTEIVDFINKWNQNWCSHRQDRETTNEIPSPISNTVDSTTIAIDKAMVCYNANVRMSIAGKIYKNVSTYPPKLLKALFEGPMKLNQGAATSTTNITSKDQIKKSHNLTLKKDPYLIRLLDLYFSSEPKDNALAYTIIDGLQTRIAASSVSKQIIPSQERAFGFYPPRAEIQKKQNNRKK